MSLRTDYTGALDSKLAEARAAGRNVVIDSSNEPNPLASLTTAMTDAANKGQKSFTYTADVGYQSADIRTGGFLWDAFRTGIIQGLAEQDIMVNEQDVVLNLDDQQVTKVDIKFSF